MTRSLLLDTNAFLWFTMDSPNLKAIVRDAIEDGESAVFVSWATAGEISIKFHRKLLLLLEPPRSFFQTHLKLNRFLEFPVVLETILFSTELQWHHRDPFDRILVAQALRNDLELISADRELDFYGVKRLW